ncbi:hypothetical protein RM553_12745 [Zunongwangia sp. F363]|uniref:Uncharacterized protein n=1 Tax=Autumnicola tepida TaxID=3075595 RepID=A0ABU3CBI3_9FLAO|nr:hypothetical protein [Zunongwangia sp. F363]MDT0643703.1 hypothetical protein [Zunongwangia sp. F363]
MKKRKPVIQIVTPQFDRDKKIKNQFIPKTKKEFLSAIESAKKSDLKMWGFGEWCSYKSDMRDEGESYLKPGEVHYLLPAEWYNCIPNGFEVLDIFGKIEKFKKGITDDDRRFGCLCYGIKRKF